MIEMKVKASRVIFYLYNFISPTNGKIARIETFRDRRDTASFPGFSQQYETLEKGRVER